MRRPGLSLLPGVLLVFAAAGCHSNQNPAQPQPVASSDPAAANLAPASDTTENLPPPADDTSQDQADRNANGAPPPSGDPYGPDQTDQGYDQGYDDTAEDVASQPPPPIPDYEQPPVPGDDYIWTPGYWAYAPDGYYWVPGAWVLAPWVGALWTPGYWGFDNDRYHWHHGYWGPHIGFYGGVNYGHGYDGDGYEGGYWRSNRFYYNTAVSRVNHDIRDVYDYRVSPRNRSSVSYNGGHGGLDYRATAAQQAAQRERHVGALPSQRNSAHNAQNNQAQFDRNNHGHPQTEADTRPMNDGRSAPSARPEEFHQPASPGNVRNGGAPMAHQPARTSPQPFNRSGRQPEQPNHPSPAVTVPNREPNPAYHPQAPGNRPENARQPNGQRYQQPEANPQPRPNERPNGRPQSTPRGNEPRYPRQQPPQANQQPHPNQFNERPQPTPRGNPQENRTEPRQTHTEPSRNNPGAGPPQENRSAPPNRDQPNREQPHQGQPNQEQPHQEQPHQEQRQQEQPRGNSGDDHPHGAGAA